MKSKYTKKQRVLAILGIILLVGLYLAALIASFFNFFSFLQRKILRHQMTTINHLGNKFPIKGVFGPLFFRFSAITSSSISI